MCYAFCAGAGEAQAGILTKRKIQNVNDKEVKKITVIFLLCIVIIMCSGIFNVNAAEAPKELKILAIGNSFSVDAMEYLWDIANDCGVKLVLGNLYIGGCSIDTHASNISADKAAYTYYKNTSGKWTEKANTSVATAIAEEKWDIITVQQASPSSGVASSYAKLPFILRYIEKTAPDAKVYFHMTWAYQQDTTHSGFANYKKDQMTMYNSILSAVDSRVKSEKSIVGIIPSGTAIQNLRTSYLGDTLTRDGYHLSYDIGRYTAALTWFTYLTGIDISTVDWIPPQHLSTVGNNIAAIRDAVNGAIASPYAVTKVTAKAPGEMTDAEIFASLGYNINSYKTIDWVHTVQAYYNSASSFNLVSHANSTASNLKNFIASHMYTKDTLPVGSVIIMDKGYRVRPEGWVNKSYKATSSTRPAIVSNNVTVITDEWWSKFEYRAFNLTTSPTKTMVEADAEHMRIYVPLYPDIKLVNSADTNADGKIDISDALITLRTLANEKGTASDVNRDGLVTAVDVMRPAA